MTQEVILWRYPASLRAPPQDARQSRDPEFIRTLGADIKRRGMRQPICCRKVGADLEVVTGESRRQASLFAGIDLVPVRIIEEDLPPAALLLEQLLENDLRRDFTYLERFGLYTSLMQVNQWSQIQLAEAIGRSPAEVTKVLAIKGKLPDDLIEKVQSGQLPVTVAYSLSRLPQAQQMREFAERYEAGSLTRDELDREITRILGNRKPKVKEVRCKEGKASLIFPGDWTWEQLIAFASQLVEASKRGAKHALPVSALPNLLRKEG